MGTPIDGGAGSSRRSLALVIKDFAGSVPTSLRSLYGEGDGANVTDDCYREQAEVRKRRLD